MIPFVLPNIFYVCENCTKDEFVNHILSCLKPIMKVHEPVQVFILLWQLNQKIWLLLLSFTGSIHIPSKHGIVTKISTTRRYKI